MQRFLPYFVVGAFLVALAVAILPKASRRKLGLDLVGGSRGEYKILATDNQPVTPDILNQTRAIIENRVNATGVTEPIITDPGRRPHHHRAARCGRCRRDPQPRRARPAGSTSSASRPVRRPDHQQGSPLPAGMAQTRILSGDQISAARPATDTTRPAQPVVSLELKGEGATAVRRLRQARLRRQRYRRSRKFAIVLDKSVVSAPTLSANHFGGQAQISGSFTQQQINDLVTVLKFGSLPLEIQEVGFSTRQRRRSA